MLNKENELIINISFDDAYIMLLRYKSLTSENLDEFKNDKKYQKLIETNINTWLKTIIHMADFATVIYKKTKARTLLKNI